MDSTETVWGRSNVTKEPPVSSAPQFWRYIQKNTSLQLYMNLEGKILLATLRIIIFWLSFQQMLMSTAINTLSGIYRLPTCRHGSRQPFLCTIFSMQCSPAKPGCAAISTTILRHLCRSSWRRPPKVLSASVPATKVWSPLFTKTRVTPVRESM